MPDFTLIQLTKPYMFDPRFRIPYCPTDSLATIANDQASISFTCEIYPVGNPSSSVILSNCAIPAYNMSTSSNYIL